MDIKPIKTEADHEAAIAEIETLMDAQPDTPGGDRLDILTTLVEAWEAKHHVIEEPDPMLARKRPLTISMIRRLNKKIRIPAEVLIRAYDVSDG